MAKPKKTTGKAGDRLTRRLIDMLSKMSDDGKDYILALARALWVQEKGQMPVEQAREFRRLTDEEDHYDEMRQFLTRHGYWPG